MDPHPAAYLGLQTLEPNWYVMVDEAVAFPGTVKRGAEGMNTNYASKCQRFEINQKIYSELIRDGGAGGNR